MNKEPDATAHHDDIDDIDDLSALEDIAQEFNLEDDDPNYNLGYQMGYNTGYIEGYEQGQKLLSIEKESDIYNAALMDVINHVNSFDFAEKVSVMQVLRLLQRI